MPYENLPESLWDKMDSCVAKVQAEGNDKDSAIAICYTALTKEAKMDEANEEKPTEKQTETTEAQPVSEVETETKSTDLFSGSVYLSALSDLQKAFENFAAKFKAGARHSSKDNGDIQSIHDLSKALGAECMGHMSVVKQADGKLRWVMFSSTAYQDRDGEIVSQKALADDVARMDAEGNYGPLDWWHIDGLNLGTCDYNALDGKVLIESGTFVNEAIGEAVKASANSLGGSIAFYHPASEPKDGVYTSIKRFARALLPKSKASNLFTSLAVKESNNMTMEKQKFDALKELVGDSLAQELVQRSASVQKAAELAGVSFKAKEEDAMPPKKTIGAMTEDELKEFIGKCMGEMKSKEAEAVKVDHAEATKALAEELTKVKNLQTVASKRVTELEKQLADLSGEQPRVNTQVYRATQDPATVRKEAQPLPTGPQADPNFINFLTGATH